MNPATDPKHPMVVLRNQLDHRKPEIANILPAHMQADRFIKAFYTAVMNNPDLLACNRQSLWNALMRAAADGLLADNREGAIVAFKDKAQWLPMVAGLLKRFRNSGQFKTVTANVVREGEEFQYWIDEHGDHMRHVPGDGSGKPIKAYAMAETKDGGIMIKVMTESQINKRRNASRAKDSPLWKEWTDEAWMKTVLRNLSKYLPSSSDLDELIQRDDEDYEFENKPVANLKPIANVAGALEAFSNGNEEEPSYVPPENEEK